MRKPFPPLCKTCAKIDEATGFKNIRVRHIYTNKRWHIAKSSRAAKTFCGRLVNEL